MRTHADWGGSLMRKYEGWEEADAGRENVHVASFWD
jgi:hypothetical protein